MKAGQDMNGSGKDEMLNQLNLLREDLFGRDPLPDKLHRVTKAVVASGHADLAGIWLVKAGDRCENGCVHAGEAGLPPMCRVGRQCLHLLASFGNHAQTDSRQQRIPLGHSLIGRTASGQDTTFVTNQLRSNLGSAEQEWAARHDLASYAGYRILSGDQRSVGELGCFRRREYCEDADVLLEGLSITTGQVVQFDSLLANLRQSEEKYRDLFENVSDFLYSHDLKGNLKEANLAFRNMFGFGAEDLKNRNIQDVMPERYRKGFSAYMKKILQHGQDDGLLRVVDRNGSERVVEYRNSVIQGPNGPIGIRGSARDITDTVKDKKYLALSEERFQQVVENAQEWVWEMDVSGLYTYANPVVEKIMGYTPAEIITIKYFFDFFLPEEKEEFKKFAFGSFTKKERFRDRIYRTVHKNGEVIWLCTSGVPILNDKGKLLGYRGVTADITKQKRTESELMRLSYFDGLTGIANRRYFEDIAHREWRRAMREGNPFSLLMVDIDFFKSYNDMYGHLEGDECLRKVSAALKENLKRPGDMIARYGGEEFVILLPNTDAKSATTVAEVLRSRIEDLEVEHAESYISDIVTISVGAASVIPTKSGSLTALVRNADQALYRAKKAGRNRVSTFDLNASSSAPPT